MYVNPFQVSMETLIGAAPFLGHRLEDRGSIRDAQDWSMVRKLQALTSRRLRSLSQRHLFSVAPLDVLVTCEHGNKQFHIIEINGTGIGGLTNMTGDAVSSVLEAFSDMAQALTEPAPLVLVASSGKECEQAPRLNKLVHEKVLYAEALKRGFDYAGRRAEVFAMPALVQDASSFPSDRPAIVLGYMKEFLDHLQLDGAGRLRLFGRPVSAAVNDRFCLNVMHHFGHRVDLRQLWTMNRGFLAGADKGVAYRLLDDYLRRSPSAHFPDGVPCERVFKRDALIATIMSWIRRGKKAVIKPQGTGLGHGIEFFLDASEGEETVIERVDRSLKTTEEYYRIRGGALPYTVCEYLDTCTIKRPEHPLNGHKYELRIVVYRDGGFLRPFPSIVKIASEAYDAAKPSHLALINNITTSAQAKKTAGAEFMLPLANRETLELLGLSWDELVDLCRGATGYLRHVLDKVEDEPKLFDLPAEAPSCLALPEPTLPVRKVMRASA